MDRSGIKKFIEDFKANSYRYTIKEIFSKYLLRGDIKSGFTLFFKKGIYNNEYVDYYFKLDREDVAYLLDKYTPIYDEIIRQDKEEEIRSKKELVEKLTQEIKNEEKQ